MDDDYKLKLLKQEEEFNKKYELFEKSFKVKHEAQYTTYVPNVYLYPAIDAYYSLSSFYHTIEHTEYIVLKFQHATKKINLFSIKVNEHFDKHRPINQMLRGLDILDLS